MTKVSKKKIITYELDLELKKYIFWTFLSNKNVILDIKALKMNIISLDNLTNDIEKFQKSFSKFFLEFTVAMLREYTVLI